MASAREQIDAIRASRGGGRPAQSLEPQGLTTTTTSIGNLSNLVAPVQSAVTGSMAKVDETAAMLRRAAANQEAFNSTILPQITRNAGLMSAAGGEAIRVGNELIDKADPFFEYAKTFLDRSAEYSKVDAPLISQAVEGRMSQAEELAGQAGANMRQQYNTARDDIQSQLLARGVMPGSSAWVQALRGMAQDEAANVAGAQNQTRNAETRSAWQDTLNARLGVAGLGNQVAGVGANLAGVGSNLTSAGAQIYNTGGNLYSGAGQLYGTAADINKAPAATYSALGGLYSDAAKTNTNYLTALANASYQQQQVNNDTAKIALNAYDAMSRQGPSGANSIANTFSNFGVNNPTTARQTSISYLPTYGWQGGAGGYRWNQA